MLSKAFCIGRRGAVALEFSIVAIAFLILTLAAMEIGYDLYVQEALDNAVETAARGVQVGTDNGTGLTASQFVQQQVCPGLRAVLNCNQLIVAVTQLPQQANGQQYDYWTAPPQAGDLYNHFYTPLADADSGNGVLCTGTAAQLMLVQAWYIGPTFLGALIPSFSTLFNGQLQHITMSSAGFVNEDFSGGQTGGPCS
jgi:Flp pilus assembly protein TadG